MKRGELRRALLEMPAGGDPWHSRELLDHHIRRIALDDLGRAYRRLLRIRGRGTTRGVRLAIARFRRWRMASPMFRSRRTEARA